MNKKANLVIKNNLELQFPFDQGKYSQVWLASDKSSGRLLAVKIFQKMIILKKLTKDRFLWELKVLTGLTCAFSPRFLGLHQTPDEVMLFMDFVPGPSFFEFQKQIPVFSTEQARFYAGQIVLMLEQLHKQLIVYRDLKPENLVLDLDGYLKLVDFGSSKKLLDKAGKTFTICGTPEFLAPEILLGKGHGFAVDFWALGILVYELFFTRGPFFNNNPLKMYLNVISGSFRYPKTFPEQAKRLVSGLLAVDPSKRLGTLAGGVEDVKSDAFFEGLDWKMLLQKKVRAPVIPKKRELQRLVPCQIKSQEPMNIPMKFNKDPFLNW